MDRDEQITGMMFLDGIQYTNGEAKLRWQHSVLICINKKVAEFRVQIVKDVFMRGCRCSLLMFFIFLVNLEVRSLMTGRLGRRHWLLGKRKNMRKRKKQIFVAC